MDRRRCTRPPRYPDENGGIESLAFQAPKRPAEPAVRQQSWVHNPTYERTVDKLLASPHYGERWGRHWLDQARYADSDAGRRNEPRRIWKYREWVINTLKRAEISG